MWTTARKETFASTIFSRTEQFAMAAFLARSRAAKGEGVPDGMRMDRAGNLYVTGPGGIWIWDPEGHHLGTIILPEQPANLAWGDPELKTLYITATTSLYKLKTNAQGFVPYLQETEAWLDVSSASFAVSSLKRSTTLCSQKLIPHSAGLRISAQYCLNVTAD